MVILFTSAADSSRSERLEGWLSKIANEDMTSLRLLYEDPSAGVYSFALSMLSSREDAEDVLQDVYLSIHKSAHLYRRMGRPMEWIMTITRNLCLTKLRERKRTQPRLLSERDRRYTLSSFVPRPAAATGPLANLIPAGGVMQSPTIPAREASRPPSGSAGAVFLIRQIAQAILRFYLSRWTS